jgi:hypothetical protein
MNERPACTSADQIALIHSYPNMSPILCETLGWFTPPPNHNTIAPGTLATSTRAGGLTTRLSDYKQAYTSPDCPSSLPSGQTPYFRMSSERHPVCKHVTAIICARALILQREPPFEFLEVTPSFPHLSSEEFRVLRREPPTALHLLALTVLCSFPRRPLLNGAAGPLAPFGDRCTLRTAPPAAQLRRRRDPAVDGRGARFSFGWSALPDVASRYDELLLGAALANPLGTRCCQRGRPEPLPRMALVQPGRDLGKSFARVGEHAGVIQDAAPARGG